MAQCKTHAMAGRSRKISNIHINSKKFLINRNVKLLVSPKVSNSMFIFVYLTLLFILQVASVGH
jgi:hypothetical protein